jgi:nucleoside diphosphate kinase
MPLLLRALQLLDLQIRANAIETRLAASATGTHASVRAPALVRTLLGYTTASSAPTSTVRPAFSGRLSTDNAT